MGKRVAFTYYSCWTNLCTLLLALITDESPVWPLLTGRLPNFFWVLARLFLYSKSGKPLCVPIALYKLLLLSTTSKVTCGKHKYFNYVIAKMQWESSGQLKIWTYVGSQEPLWDVGFNGPIAQPGEHTTTYHKTFGFLSFPLLLWWHAKDSSPLPGTLGEPGADCFPKSSKL